jgi:hypothetical protein
MKVYKWCELIQLNMLIQLIEPIQVNTMFLQKNSTIKCCEQVIHC